jgi:molybdate transport system substrate-binding protein
MQQTASMLVFFLAQLVCAVVCAAGIQAQMMRIAAASDLQWAMPEILAAFKVHHPKASIEAVYGSSGNFAAQIRAGAPFAMFFSADMAIPRRLQAEGFADGAPKLYAVGHLVVWARRDAKLPLNQGLAVLRDARVRRIAIANPTHAPYGQRAKEALERSGLWNEVQRRLVFADNVAQAAQFVQTGNADVGVIAQSLTFAKEFAASGNGVRVPDSLYSRLEQGFVVVKNVTLGNKAAVKSREEVSLIRAFSSFVQSAEAGRIFARYGFTR